MTREKLRKNSHKSPRFRESYDEMLDWQDKMEIRNAGRKKNRRPKKRPDRFDPWQQV